MTAPQIHFERSGDASLDDATAQLFPYVFLPAYLRFLEEYAGWRTYYAVSSDGARLPLLVKSVRGFRLGQLLSPPLHAARPLSQEEERSFLEALVIALRRERICHRLMQPTTNCVFQAAPTMSRACRFGSFRLRLEGRDDDDLLAGMDSGHRYEIRSARKKGAEVAAGRDQLRTFFDIHAATMKESGLNHDPWEFFDGLYSVLVSTRNIYCAVVSQGGSPMGGVLVPCTRHSGHYSYGGSADRVSPPGAIKLLQWEAIRHLRDRGTVLYDFVGARLSDVSGSKLESIQNFKSRFGGELATGWIWKAEVSPWVSHVFDFAVALRRMTRRQAVVWGKDIIDQERQKLQTEFPRS